MGVGGGGEIDIASSVRPAHMHAGRTIDSTLDELAASAIKPLHVPLFQCLPPPTGLSAPTAAASSSQILMWSRRAGRRRGGTEGRHNLSEQRLEEVRASQAAEGEPRVPLPLQQESWWGDSC